MSDTVFRIQTGSGAYLRVGDAVSVEDEGIIGTVRRIDRDGTVLVLHYGCDRFSTEHPCEVCRPVSQATACLLANRKRV